MQLVRRQSGNFRRRRLEEATIVVRAAILLVAVWSVYAALRRRGPAAGMPDSEQTPNLEDDNEAEKEDEEAEQSGPTTRRFERAFVRDWRPARSLLALRDQVNKMAPKRSKAGDGLIGDKHHQSRDSDHNPWVTDGGMGVVTAIDITHDPEKGCDAEEIVEAIRASRDSRVKYLIWNRRISNSLPQHGHEPWAWRPYLGTNPHNKHFHLSVRSDKSSYDRTTPWSLDGPGNLEG